MAQINGLHVKKLKKFAGHEGEPCYQGDLYLGKTKIGFWSQDSWGANVNNVYMEEGFSETALNKRICALNQDKTKHGISISGKPWTIEYDLTHLMSDYLTLVEDEKLFKKITKKGFSAILLITDGYHLTYYSLPENYAMLTDEQLKEQLKEEIENAKKGMFQNEEIEVKIYRSLDDFVIGEPIHINSIL